MIIHVHAWISKVQNWVSTFIILAHFKQKNLGSVATVAIVSGAQFGCGGWRARASESATPATAPGRSPQPSQRDWSTCGTSTPTLGMDSVEGWLWSRGRARNSRTVLSWRHSLSRPFASAEAAFSGPRTALLRGDTFVDTLLAKVCSFDDLRPLTEIYDSCSYTKWMNILLRHSSPRWFISRFNFHSPP